jgi:hypothetical protein
MPSFSFVALDGASSPREARIQRIEIADEFDPGCRSHRAPSPPRSSASTNSDYQAGGPSSTGRRQFSLENANSCQRLDAASAHDLTVARTGSCGA